MNVEHGSSHGTQLEPVVFVKKKKKLDWFLFADEINQIYGMAGLYEGSKCVNRKASWWEIFEALITFYVLKESVYNCEMFFFCDSFSLEVEQAW